LSFLAVSSLTTQPETEHFNALNRSAVIAFL
jgi:hypothetical protein